LTTISLFALGAGGFDLRIASVVCGFTMAMAGNGVFGAAFLTSFPNVFFAVPLTADVLDTAVGCAFNLALDVEALSSVFLLAAAVEVPACSPSFITMTSVGSHSYKKN